MMQSDNMLVQHMARISMYNENGVFNCQYMVCEEDRHRANLIGELVQVRDGQLHLPMSQCEVCALFEYVRITV